MQVELSIWWIQVARLHNKAERVGENVWQTEDAQVQLCSGTLITLRELYKVEGEAEVQTVDNTEGQSEGTCGRDNASRLHYYLGIIESDVLGKARARSEE